MKEQDRHTLVEIFFTSCLLCSAAFLSAEQLNVYLPFLAAGLAAGFSFSWLTRNKAIPRLSGVIGLSAVIILLWLVYSVFTSSFVYRQVVVLCMQRMIILIVLLSFNAGSPRVLTDMQILSLPLFLSHAVWLRQYAGINSLLALAYLVSGLILLKIKFRGLFKNASPVSGLGGRSVFILAFFFIFSIAGAWLFASNYKKANLSGGILNEAGAGGDAQAEELEREYYGLQDKLQKRMQGLMTRSRPMTENQEAFAALSVLLNGDGSPLNLDQAEQSLSDFIQASPDLSGDELVTLESVLDKKIASNTGKIREDINNSLKRNPFNVKDRMDILGRVDRFDRQDSPETLLALESQTQDIIRKSSLGPGLKKEIGESVASLKDWQTMALYRKKNRLIKKELEYLRKEPKEKAAKFLAEVNKAQNPGDPGKLNAEIEELKEKLPKDQGEVLKEIKQALDLKSEMIVSEELRKAKEAVRSSGLSADEQRDIEKGLDNLKKSGDPRNFPGKAGELKERLEAAGLESGKAIEESVEAMRERFSLQKEDRINSILGQSKLPDAGKKAMKSVRDMASAKTAGDLDSSSAEAKAQVADAARKGFISEEAADGLKNDIEELKGLAKERKGFDPRGKQERPGPENEIKSKIDSVDNTLKQTRLPDAGEKIMKSVGDMASAKTSEELGSSLGKAQDQVADAGQKGFIQEETQNGLLGDIEDIGSLLEERLNPGQRESPDDRSAEDYLQGMLSSIKESPLDEGEQKVFSGLTGELFKAQTISQMDGLQEKVNAQVRSLGQATSKKEWAGKFAGDFQEMKNLRKMIKNAEKNDKLKGELDKLKNVDPEKAEGLGEEMESIVKSKTEEDMEKEVKAFEENLEDSRDKPPQLNPPKRENKSDFEIDLLPRRIVVPKGGYISLLPVAVYGGSYIRDVSAELEWVSRDPEIAGVDRKGGVSALSAGDTVVFCRYKGIESRKAQIKVTAEMADNVYRSLKSELRR